MYFHLGFLIKYESNKPAQLQKPARHLKLWIYRNLTLLSKADSENNGAGQPVL